MRRVLLVGILVAAGCAAPAPAPSPEPGDGAEFALPVLVGEEYGWEPSLAAVPDETLLVSVPNVNGQRQSFLHASSDGGATWREIATHPLARSLGDTSLSVGPDGAIYLADLTPLGNTISASRDGGATWTATPLGGPAPGNDRQWLLAASSDRLHLVSGDLATGGVAYATYSDDGGLTWSAPVVAWESRSWGAGTNGPLIEDEARGSILFAHNCRDYLAICLTTSADHGASWSTQLVADRGKNTFHDLAVAAVDAGGATHVVWSDPTGGVLSVWLATSADGAAWTAPLRLSPDGGAHLFPWIAAGAPGEVAVAWIATDMTADPNDVAAMREAEWRVVYALVSGDIVGAWNATDVIHRGSVSTIGVTPTTGEPPDRRLGDFFSMRVDDQGRAQMVVVSTEARDQPAVVFIRQTTGPRLPLGGQAAGSP